MKPRTTSQKHTHTLSLYLSSLGPSFFPALFLFSSLLCFVFLMLLLLLLFFVGKAYRNGSERKQRRSKYNVSTGSSVIVTPCALFVCRFGNNDAHRSPWTFRAFFRATNNDTPRTGKSHSRFVRRRQTTTWLCRLCFPRRTFLQSSTDENFSRARSVR